MKRRPRKIAFKLLVFLLIGAIINVAVAWAFAACVPMRKWSQTIHGAFNQDDQTWWVIEVRQCGATHVGWTARIDLYGAQRSPEVKLAHARRQVEIDTKSDPGRVTRNAPPEFGSFHEPIPIGVLHGTDRSFGWPQRSLWCRVVEGSGFRGFHSARVEGGLRLDHGVLQFESRILPLWPLFPGFAINTIFYAAIVWMLIAVPGAVRRRIGGVRIKRGQCAACGYSLRGTPDSEKCPECGATSPQRGAGM